MNGVCPRLSVHVQLSHGLDYILQRVIFNCPTCAPPSHSQIPTYFPPFTASTLSLPLLRKMITTQTSLVLGTAATLIASSNAFVAPMAVRSVSPAASSSSLRMSVGSDFVATLPGTPFPGGKVRSVCVDIVYCYSQSRSLPALMPSAFRKPLALRYLGYAAISLAKSDVRTRQYVRL